MSNNKQADYAIVNNTMYRLKAKFTVYKGWSRRDNRGEPQYSETYTIEGTKGSVSPSEDETAVTGEIGAELSKGTYDMELELEVENTGAHLRTNTLPIAVGHVGFAKLDTNTFDIRPNKTRMTKGTSDPTPNKPSE